MKPRRGRNIINDVYKNTRTAIGFAGRIAIGIIGRGNGNSQHIDIQSKSLSKNMSGGCIKTPGADEITKLSAIS